MMYNCLTVQGSRRYLSSRSDDVLSEGISVAQSDHRRSFLLYVLYVDRYLMILKRERKKAALYTAVPVVRACTFTVTMPCGQISRRSRLHLGMPGGSSSVQLLQGVFTTNSLHECHTSRAPHVERSNSTQCISLDAAPWLRRWGPASMSYLTWYPVQAYGSPLLVVDVCWSLPVLLFSDGFMSLRFLFTFPFMSVISITSSLSYLYGTRTTICRSVELTADVLF